MPATFVTAGTATFTIAGTDYSCQITRFNPGLLDETPDPSRGEITACGDALPDESESYKARPVLEFVHDWATDGVSRALAGAVGTNVALVVNLDTDTDNAAHARTYTFDVIVPPVPDDWTPGKLERGSMTFAATSVAGPTFA